MNCFNWFRKKKPTPPLQIIVYVNGRHYVTRTNWSRVPSIGDHVMLHGGSILLVSNRRWVLDWQGGSRCELFLTTVTK